MQDTDVYQSLDERGRLSVPTARAAQSETQQIGGCGISSYPRLSCRPPIPTPPPVPYSSSPGSGAKRLEHSSSSVLNNNQFLSYRDFCDEMISSDN
ncbi:hypothetical protein NA56DRAFT_202976 [Hyaloscypha hepaticicola]|uniref:Uncharacterized protein n=1 Tax=Hyaloscypha hepaticicola TaxID=2082293 RepID=A0A2J6PZU0_9HELO|nr:hypothetical protein NA56DRAFT_202976 [Hyaloscypha hepaticicola]